MDINIYAAWIAFLAGGVAGTLPGLFFHSETWLGGYASWKRRMIRLAHIAFFGIGALNLAFALTVRSMNIQEGIRVSAILLIVGVITMPLVCYLSAWKTYFRNFFFIPASAVILSFALFVWRILS